MGGGMRAWSRTLAFGRLVALAFFVVLMKAAVSPFLGLVLVACSPTRVYHEAAQDGGDAFLETTVDDRQTLEECIVVIRCVSKGAECGLLDDGCGGTIDCGLCPSGEECGSQGIPNKCPKTDSGPDVEQDVSFDASCEAGDKACDGLQIMECAADGSWKGGAWCSEACVNGICGCVLPWGGVLPEGQSTTAFEHDSEVSPELCAHHSQQRICQSGVLTGTYPYGDCVQHYRDCQLQGYGALPHGKQIMGYDRPTVACGSSCAQTTFSCHDGSVLGGEIFFSTCAEDCTCGPYPDITVTGSNSGWVGGSNPYTFDSAMARAAVHAGLVAVGETATIKRWSMGVVSGFTGSTQNGITTSSWSSATCGVYLTK
jgi:hypothetical protein